jgi:hypothetical protein
MVHFCNFLDTTGFMSFEDSVGEGRRKGSAPLGEAWLFDDTSRKSILLNLRYVLLR